MILACLLRPTALRAASVQSPLVVVAHAPEAEQISRRVGIELELLGYKLEGAANSETAIGRISKRRGAAAAIWVRSRRTIELRLLDSTQQADTPNRVVIEARPGELPELFALRAVEVLRGRLVPVAKDGAADPATLETQEQPGPSPTSGPRPMPRADSPAPVEEVAPRPRAWSLGAGPGLLATTEFSPMLLGMAEVSWTSDAPWSVALSGAASLRGGSAPLADTRTDATGWLVALSPRFRLLSGRRWALEAGVAAGWRSIRLDRQPEPPFESFTQTQSGPFGGAGATFRYGLTDWLELLGSALVVGGPRLAWVVPTGPQQSQGKGEGQSSEIAMVAHIIPYALARASF